MYVGVGRYAGDLAALAHRADAFALTWNPPGWGSYASLDLRRTFPDAIPGDWRLAMLVGLKPGSFIPFHRDDPAAENGLAGIRLTRVHLVLTTNPASWTYHAGDWQQLEAGGLYTMNPAQEHAAINLGETVRLHLVVDVTAEGV